MMLPTIGVLCGGAARRLGAIASTIPKSLIPVAGEPFLAHQLRLLARQGFKHVVLMIGRHGEQIRAFANNGQRFGLRVDYSDDGDILRGTGGAVCHALPLLGEYFFVTYGDSWLEFDPVPMWKSFYTSGTGAMMAVIHNRNRWGQSNVAFDGVRVLCHDKSGQNRPGMDWIDWGMSIFAKETINNWPGDGPFDLAELTQHLAAAGRLSGFEVTSRFYEIGNPIGLAETEARLALLNEN